MPWQTIATGLFIENLVTGNAEQIFVVAQVLRGTPARDEQAAIFLRIHVLEGQKGKGELWRFHKRRADIFPG